MTRAAYARVGVKARGVPASLCVLYAHGAYSGAMRWTGYAWALGATAACTAAGLAMRARFDVVNIAMVYLLAVVIIALRFSRGPAVMTSILSVAAFDFLFVPPRGVFTVDDAQYLLTFAIMLAVGLIISRLVESVRAQAKAQSRAQTAADTERVRNALLASISHDLRTPLAVMAGASSSLAERGELLPAAERRALARSIFEQAREMSEQVAKVLQMTRLECGAIELERDWDSIADIAGAALARLRQRLAHHRVIVELPNDLPLVRVDATLIDQALANLLENAAKHTPPGTLVRLRAKVQAQEIVVSVEDFGPGLTDAELEGVFAKFQRAAPEATGSGVGLGLAICRAIVALHGGRVWAEQLPGGGTAFRFALPVEAAPEVPLETAPA
jgi:two-component system sensor histidine kinase KdpD